MKTDYKKKEKQLIELLGDNFNSTTIDLIQICKVKNQYENVGDIVSMNEHYLDYIIEYKKINDGYIDGWEIPFNDYEIRLSDMGNNESYGTEKWFEIEKQISKILECKQHIKINNNNK